MADVISQVPSTQSTFVSTRATRIIRRSSQELGIQITVHDGHSAFVQNYLLGDRFGSGGFGHVHLARRIPDNRLVVVKEIRSDRIPCWCQLDDKLVPIEVVLLALCQGLPGVVKFLDAYNLGQSWVLVMDRVSDATCDMFDYIGDRGTLTEPEAAQYFHQLIGILLSCHQVGVLHRDIKDENILINRVTNELVLIDFGSGAFLEPRRYTDFDGTRVYCPPEWILTSSYDGKQAEVWSLGVLLYDMLCGDIPFLNDKAIISGKLRYRKDNLSKAAKDLIGMCLNMDPNRRPTLTEILKHPWMLRNRPTQLEGQPEALINAVRVSQTATETLMLDEFSITSSLRDQQTIPTLHTIPERAHPPCSHHSSYSSPSPPIFDNDSFREGLVKEPHPRIAASHANVVQPMSERGADTVNTNMRCSTGSLDKTFAAFPVPISASSPNNLYLFWSGQTRQPCISNTSSSSQDILGRSAVVPNPAVPTTSSLQRLHSNLSGSSSGYYSRSDSLSSSDGLHTIVCASQACPPTNSVVSCSSMLLVHSVSRPPCSTTSTTNAIPQILPHPPMHAQFWQSRTASVISSSSSSASANSNSFDCYTSYRSPSSSLRPEHKATLPTHNATASLLTRSPPLPHRRDGGLIWLSSSSSDTPMVSSTPTSVPTISTNSSSYPTLPVTGGAGYLYPNFSPTTDTSPRSSDILARWGTWFSSSDTTRG